MTSDDARARPVFALESGPAAGVVAALGMAQRLGIENAIAFDMGGTTAKASLIEHGAISRGREYEVGGSISAGTRLIRGSGELLRIPTIDIAEVGAGGGSIAWLDAGGGLQVGPRSAGADPGPACYGRGGVEPTVTDANVVLGLLPEGEVADGEITLPRERATEALERVATPLGLELLEAADGIHRIANARMTRALRSVSSEKGRDPRDFAIIAYGGSGPVHAARLAVDLGVRPSSCPRSPGCSAPSACSSRGPSSTTCARATSTSTRSTRADRRPRRGDGARAEAAFPGEPAEWAATADLRYGGQSWEIEVALPERRVPIRHLRARSRALRARFEDEHELLYGVRGRPGSPVELRALRLAALGPLPAAPFRSSGRSATGSSETRAPSTRTARLVEAPVRSRASIGVGRRAGPAARRRVRHDGRRPARLVGATGRGDREPASWSAAGLSTTAERRVDPVTLQIVANALASIADEMATTIIRTAHSTVVRDGMDFSSAILDPRGETIAQAVTVPFHLGSMPAAIERLLDHYGDRLAPGDVFIMNDPFDGGMHLQDIFLVKPVHHEGELIGLTVTTAHHGDVGGRLPGLERVRQHRDLPGGPPAALAQALRGGRAGRGGAQDHRGEHPHPADDLRRPRRPGRGLLRRRAGAAGARRAPRPGGARALTTELIDYTERLVRQEIPSWPDGTATFTDFLGSDGIDVFDVPITATVTIAGDELTVDLTESAPMVRGSLNSTRSFVAGVRLPRRALRARGRRAEHLRRVPARERADEAGDGLRGDDARRVVDARRHGLPGARRAERRARAADPRPHPGGRRGRQHARDLRRRATRGRPVRLLRARRRHVGRDARRRRERRRHEPGQPRGEHPRRGRRVGVPDRRRALRPRARLGRARARTAAASRSSASGGA